MTQFTCPRCGFINAYTLVNPNAPPPNIKYCPNCGWGNGVALPSDGDTSQ
jgi:ribosomal protein S27AE